MRREERRSAQVRGFRRDPLSSPRAGERARGEGDNDEENERNGDDDDDEGKNYEQRATTIATETRRKRVGNC